jgi:hypothetical protein
MNRLACVLVPFATLALALEFAAADARAAIILSFDEPQLVDNDAISQFYNGGTTFLGIDGGPDYGVSFTLNARNRTQDVLVGDYTVPGYLELKSDTAREGEGIRMTMDAAGGFVSRLDFSYATIDSVGQLQVFSGLDGTGDVLATLSLPITSSQSGPGVFVADSLSFSGVGRSLVFAGGNKQLAIDDLALTPVVPEPPTGRLLALACVLCLAAGWWRAR